jgi:hypothetical protein
MELILGRRYAIDTNLVGRTSPAMDCLWEYHRGSWIQLLKTDTLDTELSGARDPERRRTLLDETALLIEQLGPLVLDHSRPSHAVLGSPADQANIDKVIRTLFPNEDPRAPGASHGKQRVRDAMHVNTAKRYGLDGLITNDEADLLRRAAAVKAAFDGFLIVTPEQALASVERLHARYLHRQDAARLA